MNINETEQQILNILDHTEGKTSPEITALTELSISTIYQNLSVLKAKNKVKAIKVRKRVLWFLKEKQSAPR